MRKPKKVKYTPHDKERFCKADKKSPNDERSPFERDRSRIVHSAAFRRLQGKTQVFTLGEGDFFRTRLTHSIEVAQIGKGLALRLGADPDLVEAISLVHDIGHPPFGHAGEDQLKQLMEPYGGFEANAQNLRILTKLENKSTKFEGLNLTRAVIDGQLKYKKAFPADKRKFIYKDDLPVSEWASSEALSSIVGVPSDSKSFECQIMDWADEVAYAVHDFEDSIHAGYINSNTLFKPDTRVQQAIDETKEKFIDENVNAGHTYEGLHNLIVNNYPDFRSLQDSGTIQQRKASRKQLTSLLINRYVQSSSRIQRGEKNSTPISERYYYAMDIPQEFIVEVKLINSIIMKLVIKSPQVYTLEEKGKHIIQNLFSKFMEKDNAQNLLPDDWKEQLQDVECEGNKARVVCDYISGMTDDFAQRLYSRLFLPRQGSIFEML